MDVDCESDKLIIGFGLIFFAVDLESVDFRLCVGFGFFLVPSSRATIASTNSRLGSFTSLRNCSPSRCS